MNLPEIKQVRIQTLTFPTAWQTVIFRNYGYVCVSRIAKTLGCNAETVHFEAKRLGLPAVDYHADFEKRGFLTLIRNNWHLLPYGQLMTLLDFTEERLAYVLEKEDFFGVKLGSFKPDCPAVSYTPLTEEQISQTEEIAKQVSPYVQDMGVKPFDFFPETICVEGGVKAQGKRILHGYLSPCGDVFATDGSGAQVGLDTVLKICYQILLPFIAGQLSQTLLRKWVLGHKTLIGWNDKSTIWLVVYTAFSNATSGGYWDKLQATQLAGLVTACLIILCLTFAATWFSSKLLGFNREDQIAIVFCGSKKSLAVGAPMMMAIFGTLDNNLLLPLMVFHQVQLMLCAHMARLLQRNSLSDTGGY